MKPRKTHVLGVDCVSMIFKGQTTIKPLPALLKCNAFPPFSSLGSHPERRVSPRRDSFCLSSAPFQPAASLSDI